MAHKKGAGSSRNGRESHSKRLGIKLYGGQKAIAGNIIVRQRGTKHHPEAGVGIGKDHTLFALMEGRVVFKKRVDNKSYVSILSEEVYMAKFGDKKPIVEELPNPKAPTLISKQKAAKLDSLLSTTPTSDLSDPAKVNSKEGIVLETSIPDHTLLETDGIVAKKPAKVATKKTPSVKASEDKNLEKKEPDTDSKSSEKE